MNGLQDEPRGPSGEFRVSVPGSVLLQRIDDVAKELEILRAMGLGQDHETRLRIVERVSAQSERVEDRLERIEAKLAEIATTTLADHESRVRALEQFRWGLPASLVGSAVAVFLALMQFLNH